MRSCAISVAVFSLLCATRGWTQEPTPHVTDAINGLAPVSQPSFRPNWLRSNWGLPILYAGVAADWHSTHVGQNRFNIPEGNAMLRRPDGRLSEARYWAINGGVAAAFTLAQRFAPRRAKWLVNIPAAFVGGYRLRVAVHNYRLTSRYGGR